MAQSPQDLRIAILGAGMGGLTCALALAKRGFKNIDVYEYASDLGFVGAGIQLAPNMARVLDSLGVWKEIEAEAVNILDTSVRSMYSLPGIKICTNDRQSAQRTMNSRMSIWDISKKPMAIRTWLATGTHSPTASTTAASNTQSSNSTFQPRPNKSTLLALDHLSQRHPATAVGHTASRPT